MYRKHIQHSVPRKQNDLCFCIIRMSLPVTILSDFQKNTSSFLRNKFYSILIYMQKYIKSLNLHTLFYNIFMKKFRKLAFSFDRTINALLTNSISTMGKFFLSFAQKKHHFHTNINTFVLCCADNGKKWYF